MRPLLQQGDVLGSDHARRPAAAMTIAQQRARGRMMERADHRGHIAERQPLHAAIPERSLRLALEIDNHKILAREEQLAQAEIPVTANALAAEAAGHQALEPPEN